MAAACYEKNKVLYAAMSIVRQFIEQEDEARIQIIQRNMLSRYLVMWAQGASVLPPPLIDSSSEEDSEDDDDDEDSDDDDDRDSGISQQERLLGGWVAQMQCWSAPKPLYLDHTT